MPMIYKRFTEKSAEEWRQIYKALQLLEYLVKHGSERVIDDARSHISTIKMLRNFHYIDEKMKDQGINVRNRAKELAELLQDSERIRAERRKAKSNTKKFGAVSSESAFPGSSSAGFGGSGKKYGGFSSDDYGSGGIGAVYGDGGGFTSTSSNTGRIYGDGGGTSAAGSPAFGESSAAQQSARREKAKQQRATSGFAEGALGSVAAPAERFDEYDEYDEGSTGPSRSSAAKTTIPKPIPKKFESSKPPKKEVDLFSFDDEPISAVPAGSSRITPSSSALPDDDDDFDDFQSASTTIAAPQPVKAASLMNVMGPASPQKPMAPGYQATSTLIAPPAFQSSPLTNSQTSPTSQFASQFKTSSAGPPVQQTKTQTGPNYYASGLFQTQTTGNTIQAVPSTTPISKPKAADAFGDLLSGFKKPEQPRGESLAEMNKKTASAGIWGAPKAQNTTQDDDDFGDFSGSASKQNGSNSNTDLLF